MNIHILGAFERPRSGMTTIKETQMKNLILALVLLVTPMAFAANSATTAPADSLRLVHVNDLETWMKTAPTTLHIYDANNDKTRDKEGVIPGAVALPSANHYDIAATLPADKNAKLVFYCANTGCMASHDAAKMAIKAGYTDVSVMADGIEGWKKAGKPSEKFAKKS
jgi:rhodanese-related sulfurtransferase